MATQAQWVETVIPGMLGPPFNTISPDTSGGKDPFRAHDALAAGMPTTWNWYRGARRMGWNSPPTAIPPVAYYVPILTGRAGDADPNTHGKNYRTHVRNYEMWFYGATSRRWILLDATTAKGSYYTKGPKFSNTGSMTRRTEADGSVSFAPKENNWQHFYTSTYPYRRPAERALYLHMRAEMKLSGTDAASAKVIGGVGADYKPLDANGKTLGSAGAADGSAPNVAVLSCAMHYLTPQYKWFTSTTMYEDEIRAMPPPAPAGWLDTTIPDTDPDPEPTPNVLAFAPSTIIQ